MLSKQEAHLMKPRDEWLGEAPTHHIEAYSVLHDLMHEHASEHENCGAVSVAHAFTGVAVMAIQSIKWQAQSTAAQDEEIKASKEPFTKEQMEAHEEELKQEMVALFQGWIGINQALNGLHSAYAHIGHDISLTASPVDIDMVSGAPRPAIIENESAPTEGPGAPKRPGPELVKH